MSKTAARRYRIVRWNESTRRGWVVVVDPGGDSDVWNVLDYFETYSGAVAYLVDVDRRRRVLECEAK
jgi:hypothetical protein